MQRKAISRSAQLQEGAIRRVLTIGMPQPYEGVGKALRSTFRPGREAIPDDMLDMLAQLD